MSQTFTLLLLCQVAISAIWCTPLGSRTARDLEHYWEHYDDLLGDQFYQPHLPPRLPFSMFADDVDHLPLPLPKPLPMPPSMSLPRARPYLTSVPLMCRFFPRRLSCHHPSPIDQLNFYHETIPSQPGGYHFQYVHTGRVDEPPQTNPEINKRSDVPPSSLQTPVSDILSSPALEPVNLTVSS